jgi:5-methylcytosine-specific restriction endonuclease McrA
MKKHIKIYLDYFGYCEQDIIPSEVSGDPANSIHHIKYKSQGGKDEIENLIALTDKEHKQAHRLDKKRFLSAEELREIHKKIYEEKSL